jgi:hypothetical protein
MTHTHNNHTTTTHLRATTSFAVAPAIATSITAVAATDSAEVSGTNFSFVEINSGLGYVSTKVAAAFPRATVISIEGDEERVGTYVESLLHICRLSSTLSIAFYYSRYLYRSHFATEVHLAVQRLLDSPNNLICGIETNSSLIQSLYDSPEFFRYVLLRDPFALVSELLPHEFEVTVLPVP